MSSHSVKETSHASRFGWCCSGSFRRYAEPCGLLHYIIQEPTTKRCTIVEERPASLGVGVVIGGIGFGVRTEAESRMRSGIGTQSLLLLG
jgi:hypothetical protein